MRANAPGSPRVGRGFSYPDTLTERLFLACGERKWVLYSRGGCSLGRKTRLNRNWRRRAMSEHDACPDDSLLTRLAQGTLAAEECPRVASHVESCSRCRQALAQMAVSVSPLRAEDTGIHPEHPTLFQTRSLRTRGAEPEVASVLPAPEATPPPRPVPPPFPFLGPPTRPGSLGQLGPYEITRLIGQGGMGIVFLAEDPELGRSVAVKVMKPELARDPFARQRFVREARATAAVSSPHIVTIYRVGQDNDIPYLTMEYLQGEPLDRWLERVQRLTPGQAVRLGRGIAAGLAAAHEAGLIHRDIKPANIWMETRRATRRRARCRPVRTPVRDSADQDPRFRPGPVGAGQPEPDAKRPGGRHTRLHGSGAGRRRAGRCPLRPVQPGLRAVPIVHGAAAVRRSDRDGGAEDDRTARAAAAARREPGAADGTIRPDRLAAVEKSGAAARLRTRG